jgi:putative phage-type endonuclease
MLRHDDIDQGTDEWHQIRKGKITGTVLKNIMGTPAKRQDAIYEMIGDRLAEGLEDPDENAMDRGTRLESDARTMFEFETGKKVEQTGFAEDDNNFLIANSPDGLIGETEAVEIKCPGRKNHVKVWLTNTIPDEYVWQVVQYFIVNEKLTKLYFVSYHPEITVHPMHIIEVTKDKMLGDITRGKRAQEVFLQEVEAILATIIKV